jgi:hypothetical protein
MTQASIGTIPHNGARSGFAWFLRATSEAFSPRDCNGSPAAPQPCSANPISGHARPILDQRTNATLATSEDGSIARKAVRSHAPARGKKSLSTGRVLAPHHAALPDYIGKRPALKRFLCDFDE